MKHGLMFGGFYPRLGNMNFGVYGSNDSRPNAANYEGEWMEELASMVLFRAFGNHKIATYLRKKNWDIEVLDYTTEFDWEELTDYIDERITEDTIFCGWSVVFSLSQYAKRIVNKLIKYIRHKYPHVVHISGGWYGRTLKDIDTDYWIIGNAEYAMDAILDKHTGFADNVEHLVPAVNNNGHKGYIIDAVHTHKCFPKPDANISYEERDYIQPYECLSMELSRGCRFACKYCMFPLIGMKGDTTRNMDSVYVEMLENYERWGVQNYYLSDDTTNDRAEKMQLLAEATRKLPFQPFIGGYARLDLLLTHGQETWDHMIEAGYTAHHYGIETLNHTAGKIVGKGMHPNKTKEGMLEVEEYFRKHSPTAYSGGSTFIAGLEEEDMKSLEETQRWLNKYWKHQRVAMHSLDLNPTGKNEFEQFDLSNMKSKFVSGKEIERYGASDYKFYTREEINNLYIPPELERFFGLKARLMSRDFMDDGTIWVHPSREYDMIDAFEFVNEFIQSRNELGADAETCFRIHVPLIADWKERDTELRKYFNNNPKKKEYSNIISHVAKYKEMKLNETYREDRYALGI